MHPTPRKAQTCCLSHDGWYVLAAFLSRAQSAIDTVQSNKVNGRENMDCQSQADNNGCSAMHQCRDVAYPGELTGPTNSLHTLTRYSWVSDFELIATINNVSPFFRQLVPQHLR